MKILCTLLIALLMFSCDDELDDNNLEISIPVSVSDIRPQSIAEYVSSTGTVIATRSGVMAAEVEGFYEVLKNARSGKTFQPGDAVRKGEKLIKLKNAEFENTIRLESKKLQLDISQREFEKQKSLHEKGGITLRELKTAESAFIDARYNYENALLQLEKLTIRAPLDGTITELPYYSPGALVATGQPLVTVMDYRRLYTELQLPAAELLRIKKGQEVVATHYNLPDDTLSGMVSRVAPAIDPQTRAFKAMVEIDNPELILRPGMFVKIEAIVARRDSAVVLPREVIISRRRGPTVYIVEKGAAVERILTTGLENSQSVEITNGLQFNDRVVVKGFETLRDGSKVKLIN